MTKEKHLKSLQKAILECRKCPLSRGVTPVSPQGPMTAPVAVVTNRAKSPSNIDIVTEQFLRFCGLEVDDCYLTSLTFCPGEEDSAVCTDWKFLEKVLIKPKLVLLVGERVTRAFFPEAAKDFTDVVGSLREHKWGPMLPIPEWEIVGDKEWISTEWGIYSTVVARILKF